MTRHANNVSPLVCVDARPLAGGHRLRGIGTYTAALMHALDALDTSAVRLRYLWPAGQPSVGNDLPPALRDASRRLDLLTGGRAWTARDALTTAGCEVYHATAPDGLTEPGPYANVATLYDLIPVHFPSWRRSVRHPQAHRQYQATLRRLAEAGHLLAISAASKADACDTLGIAPERISVVPLAADPARAYVPSCAERSAARSELGLEEPYFLSVAASDPHKNLPRLVEAFAAFRDRLPEGRRYHLYLLGAWMGSEARRITAQIERFGLENAVHHLTGVPNRLIASLYAGATALVYPSLMEGFGLPLLEAMRCETAVITSDCSSMPEVCGDAALYLNPEDTYALTDRMHLLAANPTLRADLIARGRVRSALFSWERTAHATLSAYVRSAGLDVIASTAEQSQEPAHEETDTAGTYLTAV